MFSRNSGLRLSSCYGTECHKEFVVHRTGVVEKGADNFLDAVLAFVVEQSRCITFGREL